MESMKYLLILLFAGVCLSAEHEIEEYELSLTPKETKFDGEVTLTLSDTKNVTSISLNTGNVKVKTCIFHAKNNPSTNGPKTTQTTSQSTPSTTQSTPNTTQSTPNTTQSTPSTTQSTPSTTQSTPNTTQSTPNTTQSTPSTTQSTPSTTQSTSRATTTKSDGASVIFQKYAGETTKENCTWIGGKIEFGKDLADKKVTLTFSGRYDKEGFSKHDAKSGDKVYVADMTKGKPSKIFPCQEDGKARLVLKGDGIISNIQEVTSDDKVSLKHVVFATGDIVVDEITSEHLKVYRTKNSGKMGDKLKSVITDVAESFTQFGVRLNVLFAQLDKNQNINARGIIILSDEVLKENDSAMDFTDLVYSLLLKLFQRGAQDGNTFLDIALPVYIMQKITKVKIPMEYFVPNQLQARAFGRDGLPNSKSLEEEAENYKGKTMPQDPILYSKGLSIIGSLASICGVKFDDGIKNYITKRNSEVAFAGCFESEDQCKKYFTTWAKQPGYPVVHAVKIKDGEYNLIQERFLWFGERKENLWLIPFQVTTNEEAGKMDWLDIKENFTIKTNTSYFLLNKHYKGFYRVNYDGKVWTELISQLNKNCSEIDTVSRAQLIDDVFSFPRSIFNFTRPVPSYVDALQLTNYLKDENNYLPIKAALNAFSFLDTALHSSLHGKFRAHVKTILAGWYKSFGYSSTPKEMDNPLTDEVSAWACKFGVEDCIKHANETFYNSTLYNKDLSERDKNAICTVVRNNSIAWAFMYTTFEFENKLDIGMPALGCSRDETILYFLLLDRIYKRDGNSLKMAVSSAIEGNPDNVSVVLHIIEQLKALIRGTFNDDMLRDILRLALPKVNTESAKTLQNIAKDLDKYLDFQNEVNQTRQYMEKWSDLKAIGIRDYFMSKTGGGSQAKPVVLVLLVTTLLPFANYFFSN